MNIMNIKNAIKSVSNILEDHMQDSESLTPHSVFSSSRVVLDGGIGGVATFCPQQHHGRMIRVAQHQGFLHCLITSHANEISGMGEATNIWNY